MASQLTNYDRITRITLEEISVESLNRVQIKVSFTNKAGDKTTIPLLGG